MAKRLRSGYTTGACAAAAAKAAAFCLVTGDSATTIEIPFPDGKRHSFTVHKCYRQQESVFASIIKDAGDDPDVTNGAEICATVHFLLDDPVPEYHVTLDNIILGGSKGVGVVTKPGLAAKVGEPAINPVPREMIQNAVQEVESPKRLLVQISVTYGEELAKKTLNHRLGIVGGLSILGTTGIVRPVSASAWTATIQASMDVAKEAGLKDIVLSTGRTSERGAQELLQLPEEAYSMMGDYLEFSFKEAALRDFSTIHLAGMWAKITKAALKIPQTHVRNGALEMVDAAALLEKLGATGELLEKIQKSNTAREMYEHLLGAGRTDIVEKMCIKAREYGEEVSGVKVIVYLIDSSKHVVATV
ncbi:MAG: cobalt-precorrin-5B (C(1))-methyltransferase [Desulfocapsa sp.]|nr:cobalt-precorrin-5B (C(1))-methyltransferase [Desulfocapsa sp.]